jgi:hypothetical protein
MLADALAVKANVMRQIRAADALQKAAAKRPDRQSTAPEEKRLLIEAHMKAHLDLLVVLLEENNEVESDSSEASTQVSIILASLTQTLQIVQGLVADA